jgi:Transglycosylase SLT domain
MVCFFKASTLCFMSPALPLSNVSRTFGGFIGGAKRAMIPRERSLRSAAASAALIITLSQQPLARAESQVHSAAGTTDQATRGEAGEKTSRPSTDDMCHTLAQAAADNELPVEFLSRLIWQESRFDPGAVSPKGALGIAQFMPRTALARGLSNPFEPLQALRESASYLRELRTTFRGNLGLAAAAYNAGPGRVEAWLAGRRDLPGETRAYVRIITGHTADAWRSQQPPQWQSSDIPKDVPCVEVAKLIKATPRPRPAFASSPAWGPWGVQLAGNWSEGGVLAAYERLRRKYNKVLGDRLPLVLRASLPGGRGATKYLVRVSEHNRTSAEALCAKLRGAGGACAVLRNPPG